MKVMVTNNLQTDLDITNGARGVITDIILNPDEPPLDEGSVVTLKHLPECVLVKLSRTGGCPSKSRGRGDPNPAHFHENPDLCPREVPDSDTHSVPNHGSICIH
ncbi:hypothetical protein BJ322DRAFT_1052944 [Thelephora terrestris]|uniref:Uncharacterized protein n=1 Tax=Thelephora terrestris TaxID=56493 RepID=A0A9P6HHM1_9AGAM|nr:hypothetical protein BJ322DRAFT_1052944 [Thelephora terrestris]